MVALPNKPKQINLIRSRDKALGCLIPQILGLIWERGGPDPHRIHGDNNPTVRLESGIVVGGYCLRPGAFGLHAYQYDGTPDLRRAYDGNPTKVFSVHLAERAVIAPRDEGFKYHDGRCCVLSWRRGEWENAIVAERVKPRSIAHVLLGGMSKNRR